MQIKRLDKNNTLAVGGNSKGITLFQNNDTEKIVYKDKDKNIIELASTTYVSSLISNLNNDSYTYLEVPVTSVELASAGTAPIVLLPASGAGTYYEYYYTIEKTGGSTAAGTVNFYFIGTGTTFVGNLFEPLTFQNIIDGFITGGSQSNEVSNGAFSYTTLNGLNEPIVLTTYNAANPTSSASTLLAKVWYKVKTFGTEL